VRFRGGRDSGDAVAGTRLGPAPSAIGAGLWLVSNLIGLAVGGWVAARLSGTADNTDAGIARPRRVGHRLPRVDGAAGNAAAGAASAVSGAVSSLAGGAARGAGSAASAASGQVDPQACSTAPAPPSPAPPTRPA
jgi:hypothetical protein